MEDSDSDFFPIVSTVVWQKSLIRCLMVRAQTLKTFVPVTDKMTDF